MLTQRLSNNSAEGRFIQIKAEPLSGVVSLPGGRAQGAELQQPAAAIRN
ncbi:hypothetical protein SJ05684_b59690 (plasmid) [Sinorhizobium sojae CCBAU 05684]|uniref:Uncharacterized protein n=1 Tax=Sinorhizobium sojae CCBAU 05684 TaxID=716928 RepID=A0A249PM15_9HYPH|nr:hypothetical protein SJ05684_b59690 [Sinorhizobium sojae CCBAU 05684]